MTQRKKGMMVYSAILVLIAFSLSLLGPTSAYAQTEGPGTVCVLQVIATGDVMAVLIDDTHNLDLAMLVPSDNVTNLPIRCADLDQISLAVANQGTSPVSLNTSVYTNRGELKCSKGPFNIAVNGGRGVTFKDCV